MERSQCSKEDHQSEERAVIEHGPLFVSHIGNHHQRERWLSHKTGVWSVLAQILDDFRFCRRVKSPKGLLAIALDRHFLVTADYRLRHWISYLKFPLLGGLLRVLCWFPNLVVSSVTGTEIHPGAIIGSRFNVHTSFGIVIADGVVIGDDCTINAGVGLVNKANGRREGVPRIGNHVILSAGCKVMGAVTIGDYAVVGANSVVVRDVPPHHTALGIPAMNVPVAGKPAWQSRSESGTVAAAE